MTQNDFPYAPPTTPAKAPRRWGRALMLGCGGIVLAGALGIGTCALAVKEGMSAGETELAPVTDRYLREVAAGDYHSAYSEADVEMQSATSEADFTSMIRGITEQTGALRSKEISAVQGGVDTKGRWARLAYKCEFEKGPGALRVAFRKRSDGWKIMGVSYDSPQIERTMRNALRKKSDASTE